MRHIAKKVILVVLDGFGIAPPDKGNPIKSENMPFLNKLISNYPSFSLSASGLIVGLPWGTYGNSEVGHSAIGTGRVVVQSITRINLDIDSGEFFNKAEFLKVLEHARHNNSKVHLIGCVSPGGIHSHENHLMALMEFFKLNNFSNICIHMITDGEDSSPNEALNSLERISDLLGKSGARIATLSGRNFSMDRVNNWPLIERVWNTMVNNIGEKFDSAENYIKKSYNSGINDPDIEPAYLESGNNKIEDGDGMIFFNFRNDRMKQLVAPFVKSNFVSFNTNKLLNNLCVLTMTNYSTDFDVLVAYPPEHIPNTLGQVISDIGLTQLRVAEKEKEAHVTNFFDGGKLELYKGEERIIEESKVLVGKEYLEHPELALEKVTRDVLINSVSDHSLIVVNFANSDVLAHTGDIELLTKGLRLMDKSIEKIVNLSDLNTTAIVITADHGNAEEMLDPATGSPDTQHSTATVPVVFINSELKIEDTGRTLDNLYQLSPAGSLIDIAPTILGFLGINKPKEMTGTEITNLLLR